MVVWRPRQQRTHQRHSEAIQRPPQSPRQAAMLLLAASKCIMGVDSIAPAAQRASIEISVEVGHHATTDVVWRDDDQLGPDTCRAVAEQACRRPALGGMRTRETVEHVQGSGWGCGGLHTSGMDTSPVVMDPLSTSIAGSARAPHQLLQAHARIRGGSGHALTGSQARLAGSTHRSCGSASRAASSFREVREFLPTRFRG